MGKRNELYCDEMSKNLQLFFEGNGKAPTAEELKFIDCVSKDTVDELITAANVEAELKANKKCELLSQLRGVIRDFVKATDLEDGTLMNFQVSIRTIKMDRRVAVSATLGKNQECLAS